MRADHPPAVGVHFAACTALAFASSGAPFVPEAITAYAGICYLRNFLYGNRLWHGPARVPWHLGRRGYRDATLKRRGVATWPIGMTVPDDRQVWLQREDLAYGCALLSDDPGWHAEVIDRLVFGACLHQMGALILQDPETPSLGPRMSAVARPFGRDAEIVAVDLSDPSTTSLRISWTAIAAALEARGVRGWAHTVHAAVAPILTILSKRTGKDPLFHYADLTRLEALQDLTNGRCEIAGISIDSADTQSADAAILRNMCLSLQAIPPEQLIAAQIELDPYARELSATPGLSVDRGIDLTNALTARRLTCVRPSSAWTGALLNATFAESLSILETGAPLQSLIHISCSDAFTTNDIASQIQAITALDGIVTLGFKNKLNRMHLNVGRDICRLHFRSDETSTDNSVALECNLKDIKASLRLRLLDLTELSADIESTANQADAKSVGTRSKSSTDRADIDHPPTQRLKRRTGLMSLRFLLHRNATR